MEHPQPTAVKELQGFLGVINFYRLFVLDTAHFLKQLTHQLKGSPNPSFCGQPGCRRLSKKPIQP
jgi:hypothetical protein